MSSPANGCGERGIDQREEYKMSSVKWAYICMSTTCGHVEYATYAPAATKQCPCCGGTMKREEA